MTGPMSFRVVYKSVEEQEIDADIYLPDLQSGDSFASPVRTTPPLRKAT